MRCLVVISRGKEYAGQNLAPHPLIRKYALTAELSHHKQISSTSCTINLLRLTFHQRSIGTSSIPSKASQLDTLLGSVPWKSQRLSSARPTRLHRALTTLLGAFLS